MTQQLLGRWTLARSIVDHELASEISCTGSADLRPCDDGIAGGAIAYEESVSFQLAGKLIRATRAYRFHGSGGSIVATFDDGSRFFTLQLNAEGIGTAVHPCGDDLYTLTLTLHEATSWQTQWDVSGTKQQRIVTHYTR